MRPSEARLNFGHPVAYYPALVERLGSVNATLFFCQIFYYIGKENYPELGIYKSAKDIQKETGLSVDEQRTARKHLRDRGFLIETEKRLEHRIYYRLNLTKFDDLIFPIPEEENSHSAAGQSPFGELGKCGSYIEQEITTEITTEKKILPKASPSVERCLKLTGGFEDTALKPLEDEEDELGDFVSDGQQSDPRRIIDAIERHYKAANPGLAVPWSNLAFVRLKKLLASFTNWGPDEWIRCVGNRFASDGIIPGEPPESFIQHLSKYISGPLNQYGRQKGQSDENVSARTRRNRAALNAALDELDRSYEAARKRDAEVWLGQGDSLEVYWDADSGFRN